MKLKYDFYISNVGGDIYAVPVGGNVGNFNVMLRLNDVSQFIIENLKSEISYDSLMDILMNKYDESSREEIAEVLDEFLDKLKAEGILC